MSDINEMLEVTNQIFSMKMNLFAFDRIWNSKDFHDVTKYDVLSMASLFYIFSGEEKRELIINSLEENLEIDDPENAVKYVILHEINSISAAKKLFRRIPYAAGISMNNTISKDLAKTLPGLYLASTEMLLFSTVAVSPDEMHLNLATLSLRLWVDCQTNNLQSADAECDPFHDNMTWPSLEEFIDIIHENELEFDPYEPMGDPELDEIARPICEHFLEMLTDGFAEFAKESGSLDFYIPYQESEYAAALERYRFIDEYTGMHGTYTDEFQQDEEEELVSIVNKILSLTDELEPYVQDFDGSAPPFTLRDAAQLSLLKIFLYLTASDEYVSGKEVRAINDCLGYSFSKDNIKRLIQDQNIYTITFERETPPIMDLLMQLDRGLAAKGFSGSISYTKRFVELCEKAGNLFIGCDGSANEDEKRDLQTIIANYNRLAEEVERDIRKA